MQQWDSEDPPMFVKVNPQLFMAILLFGRVTAKVTHNLIVFSTLRHETAKHEVRNAGGLTVLTQSLNPHWKGKKYAAGSTDTRAVFSLVINH